MIKTKKSWLVVLSLSLMLTLFLFATNVLAKDTVLTAWHVGTTKGEKAVVNQAIKRFEADNPGVKIKAVAMNDDAYKTKLQVAASGGGMPDLFITWGGGPLKEYVKSGVVYDLTDKLKEANLYDKLPASSKKLIGVDNRLYGLPVYGLSQVMIWYNKDIFNKYDISVPKTWEEFKAVTQKLKDNGIIPIALANETKWPGSEWYEYLVYRLGGVEAYNKAKAKNGEGSFKDDTFIKAAKMLQNLVKDDAFVKGFNALSYGKGESRALIYTQRAAMELMGNWWYTAALSEAPDFVNQKIDFFPFPAVKGGKGDPSTLLGSAGGGNSWSIAQSSEHKDLAFKFLTYLADEKSSEAAIDSGRLPTLKGRGGFIEDPILKKMYDLFTKATYVQNYWDQDLPPQIGEDYKTSLQQLYGLDLTPDEFTSRLEKSLDSYYSE